MFLSFFASNIMCKSDVDIWYIFTCFSHWLVIKTHLILELEYTLTVIV